VVDDLVEFFSALRLILDLFVNLKKMLKRAQEDEMVYSKVFLYELN